MVGVWCGIVIDGGIGTGGIENIWFSGEGMCAARYIWCGTGRGGFLAGENMNDVGVGMETIKTRVYGGKYPSGEMVRWGFESEPSAQESFQNSAIPPTWVV